MMHERVDQLSFLRRRWFVAWFLAILLIVFAPPYQGRPNAGTNQSSGTAKDPVTIDQKDWPWWRGPNRNGIAPAGQTPPIHWSETENVAWKSPIPGQGHGSPTVVGNQVFLATADYQTQTQSVVSFDRLTGKQLWKTDIHQGGFTAGGHSKSNLAAASVASDGKRIYINFLNGGAVHTTALTIHGKKVWQSKVADFVIHQGFGSSPALYGSLVIASADNKGGGSLVAFDRTSGREVWRQARPRLANYTSPIILTASGRDQLILTGCELISSFDPLTGKKLWEIEGSTTEVVTSVVTDGELVFASGGYPRRHVQTVRADGSGEIVWDKNVGVYVPSMLIHAGHLFLVTDSGVAQCWQPQTGEELWKGRLKGTFSASLVLAGNSIFATNEDGVTFVFEANPKEFKLLAQNQLGDHAMATPAICDNRIYLRVAEKKDGQRHEFLYCIAGANR